MEVRVIPGRGNTHAEALRGEQACTEEQQRSWCAESGVGVGLRRKEEEERSKVI